MHTIDEAAILTGVHRSTVLKWLASGRVAKSGELRDFFDDVERAKLDAKAQLQGKVIAEGNMDATMAMRILIARYPHEWNPTRKIEFEDKTPPQKRNARARVEQALETIAARLSAPPPAATLDTPGGDEDGDVTLR
jgi:hypothetical protein